MSRRYITASWFMDGDNIIISMNVPGTWELVNGQPVFRPKVKWSRLKKAKADKGKGRHA